MKKKAKKPAAKKVTPKISIASSTARAVAQTSLKLDTAEIRKPGRLEHVALDAIAIIRNPRQRAASAEEQAAFEDSIAAQGVLEPVLVRPMPKGFAGKAKYELIAGARRFAAARKKLGGAYKIPAHIKDVGDLEARLIALAENTSRSDMHPLDEAQEFVELVRMGAKVAQLAAGAGKSDRYVQKRMKIVEGLDKAGRDALGAGKLNVSQAIALAEIADKDVQKEILDEAIDANRNGWGEEFDAESIKRNAKWAIERKKAEAERRKNPPKPAPTKRSHQKKIEYPKPGINGLYARPKKNGALGHVYEWFKGAALRIEIEELSIAHDQRIAAFSYFAGKSVYAEPLTTKLKPAAYVDPDAVAALAIERIIAHELTPALPPGEYAALGLDLVKAVAELAANGCGKEAEALEKKLKPKLHIAAEPPSKPAPAPEKRTYDAIPKAAGAICLDMANKGGVVLVRAQRYSKFPNKFAEAADMPDEVVVEKAGRFFHYQYGGEVFPDKHAAPKPADTKTPLEAAIAAKPAPAAAATPAAAKPPAGQDGLEIPAFLKREKVA